MAGSAVSVTIAAVAALMIVPVAVLVRDRPADLGIPPYGATAIVPTPAGTANPVRRALSARCGTATGYRNFWLLSGSFFVCGASTNGLIGTHLISGLPGPRHPGGARPPACSR